MTDSEYKFTSNALWPEGHVVQKRAKNKTIGFHSTENLAKAVCIMLENDGLGGAGVIFPIKTWVEEIK